jgi:hypothetical protein
MQIPVVIDLWFKSKHLRKWTVIGLVSAVALFVGFSSLQAQSFTADVWTPYTDRFGLIHTKPVDPTTRDPSTNNGLLYTAEACTIMQLKNVSYDKAKIAAAVSASQVEPGLFRRSPVDFNDAEAPDDYIGLGALAGVCGFQSVARDILAYGAGADQVSGPTIIGLNIAAISHINDEIKQCTTVPYNYNNVNPKVFSFATWMGKFPAIITHWKLAAGYRPSSDELGVWAAALILSGTTDTSNKDHWLQSWLMVLTYESSQYHSSAADFAVTQWWSLLHQHYPGGIKETMTDYLALAPGAPPNPFAEYIDDFDQWRNPSITMIDTDNSALNSLTSVGGLLSMGCGQAGTSNACIDYNDYSPTNFLAPFTMNLTVAAAAVSFGSTQVASQQHLVDLQTTTVADSLQTLASLNKISANLLAEHNNLQQRSTQLLLQKGNLIAMKLDQVSLPGHWTTPTAWGVPVGPPIWVPGKPGNPNYEAVLGSIATVANQMADLQNKIQKSIDQSHAALQDFVKKTTDLRGLNSTLDLAQRDLTNSKAALETAKGALEYAQATVQDLNPCLHVLPAALTSLVAKPANIRNSNNGTQYHVASMRLLAPSVELYLSDSR